jgi:hypothetical protein
MPYHIYLLFGTSFFVATTVLHIVILLFTIETLDSFLLRVTQSLLFVLDLINLYKS